MAVNQQLLFLPEDSTVAACLELLRRLLQPKTRSLPHVTLRHSPKPLKAQAAQLYSSSSEAQIVLDQVTTFDEQADVDGVATVVILCDLPQFEHVSYRPDFPQSVFHITVYAGPATPMASRVLEVLSTFSWQLTVLLPLVLRETSASAFDVSSAAWSHGA